MMERRPGVHKCLMCSPGCFAHQNGWCCARVANRNDPSATPQSHQLGHFDSGATVVKGAFGAQFRQRSRSATLNVLSIRDERAALLAVTYDVVGTRGTAPISLVAHLPAYSSIDDRSDGKLIFSQSRHNVGNHEVTLSSPNWLTR